MEKAKLTFLGTGTSQGIPMIGCGCEVCTSEDPRDKRLRASVLVEYCVFLSMPDPISATRCSVQEFRILMQSC